MNAAHQISPINTLNGDETGFRRFSDLNSSSDHSKKFSSSPILSDLPTLFSNLRTNDSNKNSSTESSGKTLLKKFLSLGRSDDTDDLLTQSSLLFHGVPNPFKRSNPDDASKTSPTEPTLPYKLVTIPPIFLKEGIPLLKVSNKSKKRILFKIDVDNFMVSWNNSPYRLLAKNLVSTNAIGASTSKTSDLPSAVNKKYYREIFIDDIKNIFLQEDATNYREELHISKEFEHNWLTVFYFNSKKQKLKTLHLLADSEHDFRRLVSVLMDLKRLKDDFANNFLFDFEGMDEDTLRRSLILEGEKQMKQVLTFHDILKYCKRLNMSVSLGHLRKIFSKVSPDSSTLDFEQFKKFVSILKQRDDVERIFQSNLDRNDKMTYHGFRRFLKNVQHETFSDAYVLKVFNSISTKCVLGDYISVESFDSYLNSSYNSWENFVEDDSYFDKPLNEYFISSSHNTYLMGRQIAGESSVEGYIKALRKGCRCVEIDVWDGEIPGEFATTKTIPDQWASEDNLKATFLELEPIVSHGRTFTTIISFLNVVKTIKKCAFVTSPYPVIISLETHCNLENQKKMVSTLKEILGDVMVLNPIDGYFGLPSPNQLKYRIIVKVKRTSPSSKLAVSESGKYYSSTTTTSTSFSEDNANGSKRSNSFSLTVRKKENSKICEELSDLGVYCQGIKFRNFSLPESKTFNHIFSLSEKSLSSMLKDDEKRIQVDKHNRRYLMRMYPSRYRLTSTNFNPSIYWSHGIQMVATNWQTYDLGQQLNEAMFEGVKNLGYVIKPIDLRKPLLKSMRKEASFEKKIQFCIEVVSAHALPKAKEGVLNPYVTFEVYGASNIQWTSPVAASNGGPYKTKIVQENGFTPIWEEKFSGVLTAQYDLVFVRFCIYSEFYDEKNLLGISVARLSDLKSGYRYLPISDVSGEELIYSQLFVKVDYREAGIYGKMGYMM